MAYGNDFVRGLLGRSEEFSTLIEYDASNNPIYIGDTYPGRIGATSEKVWRIKKITYDASNNPTIISHANGTTLFENIWDNRTNYSYS